MPDLKVLIVGENPLARMGLAALLAGQPGLEITGQTAGGADFPSALDLYQPDVIVWDWSWNAPETLAEAREAGLPVVALLNDPSQAASVRAAGARGLVLDNTNADSLAAALAAAAAGLVVIAPALMDALLPSGDLPDDAPVEALTPRERQVLQLVAEGLANKTIAARLNITDHTVKFHINAIMGKLNAQSRTEAVVKATRLGLIIL